MPSLKPQVEKMIRCWDAHRTTYPRCNACYDGQDSRHLQARFREYIKDSHPFVKHFRDSSIKFTEEDIEILASTSNGERCLMTLEALWMRDLELVIDTKDEYSRTLNINIWLLSVTTNHYSFIFLIVMLLSYSISVI